MYKCVHIYIYIYIYMYMYVYRYILTDPSKRGTQEVTPESLQSGSKVT